MTVPELFGDPDQWPDDDLIAITGALSPHLVLAALHEGVFPMPITDEEVPPEFQGATAWWSPMYRGVLLPGHLKVARSLRKTTKHQTTTVDRAFGDVITRCADPDRPYAWIDDRVIEAYGYLHERGWAHSVETWDDKGRLVGGLYGVSVGGLFSGESMFHDPRHGRDASKTALLRLVCELGSRLLDVQWSTPHLASLGVTEVDRAEYLDLLDDALDRPAPQWTSPDDPAWDGVQLLDRLREVPA